MADDHLFLLPIVIDDTDQATARVPEKFLTVQWLKVPGGQPTRALEAMCRSVASGDVADSKPARKAPRRQERKSDQRRRVLQSPEFPREEPGQRIEVRSRCGAVGVALGLGVLQAPAALDPDCCVSIWLAVTLIIPLRIRHEGSALRRYFARQSRKAQDDLG